MQRMGASHVYVHALEGRLRVRVPSLKGSPERARQTEDFLRAAEGIDEVSVNPRTGSILILYDPQRTAESQILETLGVARQVEAAEPPSARVLERLAAGVLQSTLEIALQRVIVALI